MNRETYFMFILIFISYSLYTSWDNIILLRSFIIFISILLIFLSWITTEIEKERDEIIKELKEEKE